MENKNNLKQEILDSEDSLSGLRKKYAERVATEVERLVDLEQDDKALEVVLEVFNESRENDFRLRLGYGFSLILVVMGLIINLDLGSDYRLFGALLAVGGVVFMMERKRMMNEYRTEMLEMIKDELGIDSIGNEL